MATLGSLASDRHPAATLAIDAEPDFDFEGPAYRDLYRRARCTAFQSPEWLSAFYAMLPGLPHVDPLIVVGRDAQGVPRLVVPLIRRHAAGVATVEYAFLGLTDYAGVVCDPGVRIDGLPTSVFRAALGRFDRLNIAPVREEDSKAWRALLGMPPELLPFGAHAVGIDVSYDAWHARMFGSTRSADLARKSRRLAEGGTVELRSAGTGEIGSIMRAAAAFRFGRFADDPLQDERFRAFYVDAARRGAAAGSARTYLLTCGGDLAAMLFGLIRGDRFCYLLLACDYARFGRCSPGMLMFDRVMRDWFDSGGRVFDFTIGDEPFKSRLGAVRTPMFRFTAEA